MGAWCFVLFVWVVSGSRFLLSNDWSALKWVDLDAKLPRPSARMAVASYNNSIFIFGGEGEQEGVPGYLSNQAVTFDVLSQTITDLGNDSLPFTVTGDSKWYTQINHLFYAIDYDESTTDPSHITIYNLITKQVSNTKPMSKDVGAFGCLASTDDLLFVIGGSGGGSGASTQMYNISSQNWTIGPEMNQNRLKHTCVVDWIDSVLYAIGGWLSMDSALSSV
eukprot:189020_1